MQAEHDLTAWLWATPNSNRVSILFEELGLSYQAIGVNIRKREQFDPAILAMNPYGKIPVVAWREGAAPDAPRHVLFESGAILLAFAERHGRLLPAAGAARDETLAWLMVALTSLGPMTGQAHHWTDLAPQKPDAAVAFTVAAVARVYRVLDERLSASGHLAGAYSIADIAAFPWVARAGWARMDLADYPALKRWHDRVAERPAVRRGMAVPDGAILSG
ncbi:MAG: glutathione binding-like protein [Beijerinckiaceae bacterium]|jgi:GST-like protein|nr:glutathione binding-like protein [Beijerinckiaceae bacterium]